jgi:hypothetical protein
MEPKMVVRKNTLAMAGDIWLQRDGSWGDYRTARRFPDQDKADAGARAAGMTCRRRRRRGRV